MGKLHRRRRRRRTRRRTDPSTTSTFLQADQARRQWQSRSSSQASTPGRLRRYKLRDRPDNQRRQVHLRPVERAQVQGRRVFPRPPPHLQLQAEREAVRPPAHPHRLPPLGAPPPGGRRCRWSLRRCHRRQQHNSSQSGRSSFVSFQLFRWHWCSMASPGSMWFQRDRLQF